MLEYPIFIMINMLNRFIQVVSCQDKYNRPGQPLDAIPIIVIAGSITVGFNTVLPYLSLLKK
jgi:hypothetical protein